MARRRRQARRFWVSASRACSEPGRRCRRRARVHFKNKSKFKAHETPLSHCFAGFETVQAGAGNQAMVFRAQRLQRPFAARLATGVERPAANRRQTRRQMKMIRRFLQAPGRARAQTFPLLQLDSMEEKHHAHTRHSGPVFAFVLRGGAGLACCVCCGCGSASGRGRV